MAKSPTVSDEWERVKSTPLTIVELTGGTTYYDKTRKTPQPINLAGIKFTETLNGEVVGERLTPWVGHNTWGPMPESAQLYLRTEWEENFRLLDPNITTLTQAFR
jgi:hypothetical protein